MIPLDPFWFRKQFPKSPVENRTLIYFCKVGQENSVIFSVSKFSSFHGLKFERNTQFSDANRLFQFHKEEFQQFIKVELIQALNLAVALRPTTTIGKTKRDSSTP